MLPAFLLKIEFSFVGDDLEQKVPFTEGWGSNEPWRRETETAATGIWGWQRQTRCGSVEVSCAAPRQPNRGLYLGIEIKERFQTRPQLFLNVFFAAFKDVHGDVSVTPAL